MRATLLLFIAILTSCKPVTKGKDSQIDTDSNNNSTLNNRHQEQRDLVRKGDEYLNGSNGQLKDYYKAFTYFKKASDIGSVTGCEKTLDFYIYACYYGDNLDSAITVIETFISNADDDKIAKLAEKLAPQINTTKISSYLGKLYFIDNYDINPGYQNVPDEKHFNKFGTNIVTSNDSYYIDFSQFSKDYYQILNRYFSLSFYLYNKLEMHNKVLELFNDNRSLRIMHYDKLIDYCVSISDTNPKARYELGRHYLFGSISNSICDNKKQKLYRIKTKYDKPGFSMQEYNFNGVYLYYTNKYSSLYKQFEIGETRKVTNFPAVTSYNQTIEIRRLLNDYARGSRNKNTIDKERAAYWLRKSYLTDGNKEAKLLWDNNDLFKYIK